MSLAYCNSMSTLQKKKGLPGVLVCLKKAASVVHFLFFAFSGSCVFGKSSDCRQKIKHKGPVGENIWLLGTVVRARRKLPDEESADAKGSSSSKSPAKGKSGKKGKGKDKAKDKEKKRCLYWILNRILH